MEKLMFDLKKLVKLQQDLQLSLGGATNLLCMDGGSFITTFGCPSNCSGACKGTCEDCEVRIIREWREIQKREQQERATKIDILFGLLLFFEYTKTRMAISRLTATPFPISSTMNIL